MSQSGARVLGHDLKELLKEKEISEDDDRKAQEDIHQITNQYVAEVDKVIGEKEAELMEI